MGIKGLYTFMKYKCNDVCKEVTLSEITEKFRNDTGKEPVLLIDIASCMERFLPDETHTMNFIIGGLKQFKENFERFVNYATQLGIKLICFAEGKKPLHKYKLWERDQKERIEVLAKVFSEENLDSNVRLVLRGVFFNALSDVMLKDNILYRRSIYEADNDIFRYGKMQETFGVMTRDTDLLMVENIHYCFCIEDLESMTVLNFSRNGLAKTLQIKPSQLKFFASLSLSYAFDCSDLYSLYEKKNINIYLEDKFAEIASLIRDFDSKEQFIQFAKSELTVMQMACLERRLKFYCGEVEDAHFAHQPGQELWDKILLLAEERHKRGETHNNLLQLVADRITFNTIACENVLLPSPGKALLKLRKKIYGILFFEHPNTKVDVTEFSCEYIGKGTKPKFRGYTVKFIRRFHVGLLKLWSPDKSEKMKYLRKKIFYQAINEKLTPEHFRTLNEEYVLPVLAAFYLLWESGREVKDLEIEAILIQAVLVEKLTSKQIAQYPNYFEKDALNLVGWFICIINKLNLLSSVCGGVFCREKVNIANFFDGKILNYVYVKLKEEADPKVFFTEHWELYERFLMLYKTLCTLGGVCGYMAPTSIVADNEKDISH